MDISTKTNFLHSVLFFNPNLEKKTCIWFVVCCFFSLPILQLFCNITYNVISTKTAANHVYVVSSFRGVYLRCGSVVAFSN